MPARSRRMSPGSSVDRRGHEARRRLQSPDSSPEKVSGKIAPETIPCKTIYNSLMGPSVRDAACSFAPTYPFLLRRAPPALSVSSTQVNAATAVGKPTVVTASDTTCPTSAGEAPASRARRAWE